MKVWIRTALLFFFIATLIGALLRWVFVAGTTWLNFQNLLHAHSHIAMLGWVFLMLYSLFIFSFLKKEQQQARIYKILFGLQLISCTGMLIAFPIQGYGPVSISFSTFHIIISYVFAWRFWKDLGRSGTQAKVAVLFIKTALIFMVISTLALWSMPMIKAAGMKGSALYYAMIQFYLHFQFNGWFVFSILGLFFKLFEDRGIFLDPKMVRRFFVLLVSSCVLTYALAVAWGNPLPFIFWINGLGVSLQLIAMIYFLFILKKIGPEIKTTITGIARILITVAISCLIIKIVVQSALIIPFIAEVAYTVRNFVIGFIHLVLLGIISTFILGYAQAKNLIRFNLKSTKAGVYLYLVAFFLTELILFGQGLLLWAGVGFLPFYYEGLFIFSALFPIGILLILIGQRKLSE